MNVLEIIIAVVLLSLIVDGYRVGLIKTIFSIVKMIIGIVLAVIVCTSLAGKVPDGMRYMVPVAFIAVIGIVLGILGAVERLLNLVDKIPIARLLNLIAGIPAGFIKGIIIIWILFLVIGYFTDTQWGSQIMDMLNQSPRLKFVESCNPLQGIIKAGGAGKIF